MLKSKIKSGEFWPAGQRCGHSLQEISYRGCFKPQLAGFFIQKFSAPGDVVCDPFMGRGTTPLEAALLDRKAVGMDANPLGEMLVTPRLNPPLIEEVERLLARIPWDRVSALREDLLAFYHPETLQKITALRNHFLERDLSNELDAVDAWIRLVALNRLSGHSAGFFSVRTMPPNQAVPVSRQIAINARNRQTPEYRDVAELILRKSRSLLRHLTTEQREQLATLAPEHRIHTGLAEKMEHIEDNSVQLVVTSPPFLNVVNYRQDNWLRCWFAGIDPTSIPKLTASTAQWMDDITKAIREMRRIVKPGGHIAIEVGEVKKGAINMEVLVIEAGERCRMEPSAIYINTQQFTKTSHCWGIENNKAGTNTNRIVLFQSEKNNLKTR
jgi:hypothetical protein